MPIKWNITAKAMKARGIMDQISAEYDGLITDGSEHLGDVKGLRAQVGEMKDDLGAAANVMGNGSGNGGADTTEKQAIAAAEVGAVPPDVLQPEPTANAQAPRPAPHSTEPPPLIVSANLSLRPQG